MIIQMINIKKVQKELVHLLEKVVTRIAKNHLVQDLQHQRKMQVKVKLQISFLNN